MGNVHSENEQALFDVVKAARAVVQECFRGEKLVRNPQATPLINLADAIANLDRLNP